MFEDAGYAALTPGWPDDPDTVEEANAHPEVFAAQDGRDRSPTTCGDHRDAWTRSPPWSGTASAGCSPRSWPAGAVRRHGGDRPAPFRGVLPLPISALKSASPVLRNPANRHRAVPLTYDQFRYGFANAVDEDEAKELYETFAVPAPASRSSRRRPPTSTRGPRPRSTARTPTADRC